MSALRGCKEIYPLFILDPCIHNKESMGVNPWRFLMGSLQDLDGSLRKLNLR
jgi:cryptochrome